MNVSAEQVLTVLERRAVSDRLISEILRAAIIEAAATVTEDGGTPTEDDPDDRP